VRILPISSLFVLDRQATLLVFRSVWGLYPKTVERFKERARLNGRSPKQEVKNGRPVPVTSATQ
jgi:hypothetical protein